MADDTVQLLVQASGAPASYPLAQAGTQWPPDPVQAGTEVPVNPQDLEGHGGGFPPFDAQNYGSQLLWLAITFGILYVVMSRVALPRLGAILDHRRERIEADIAEATRLKADSEAAAVAFEAQLADARTKAQAIAGETRDQVAAEAETRRKALESELAVKLEAAERQIAETKSRALGNVRAIATGTAGAIVARLIGREPSAGEVEQAVDAALKN